MKAKIKQKATFFEALNWASLCLKEKNIPTDEAQFLLLQQMNWNLTNLLAHYRDVMELEVQKLFVANVERLLAGEPAQYIVKKTDFYGNPIMVNPAVLIPRPETEELVDWVLQDHEEQSLKVLDLGTGSGAIAIAIKKQRPNWTVFASDISQEALAVAQQNADFNKVDINLIKSDLFKQINENNFDVIISNPPYIAENEKDYMDDNVIEYEPHVALFAKHDGLFIYEEIAKEIHNKLKNNGELYLEIGFKQGDLISNILKSQNPDAKVVLHQDLAENDRMIKMNLKGE
ncbi:peptide chain release factor N(5)-glutamine methyltransferase [Fructilactobacillus vespulae]|uniref:peptide chain release factor N(5)-glutamine methyltransferase n=1 Tax=Fructilactobacillus vespulae TaxID=1249630 RepID=UPI0039B6C96E